MRTAANIAVVLLALACLAALLTSVYPGVLNGLIFPGVLIGFIAAPIIGVVGLVLLLILARTGKLKTLRRLWLHAALALGLLVYTYAALKFYIPRRIAFIFARPAFEAHLAQASPVSSRPAPVDQRISLYHIVEQAADPRGGTYFRTYSHGDGLGPDTVSYGFVYQPNRQGTPFGAARYSFHRLSHGWYWFKASDDWD